MCVLHGGNGSCVHMHLEKRLRHLSPKNRLPYIFEFVLTLPPTGVKLKRDFNLTKIKINSKL